MEPICLVRAGSHLYGTDTPASDLDAQRVVVPDARAILLGRGIDSHGGLGGPKAPGTEDATTHTLARFVAMVLEGQAIAVEILFAPERFHLVEPSPVFRRLQEARGLLIPRDLAAFVGYCRRQAAIYGAKGDRVRAAEAARELLARAIERHGRQGRVGQILAEGSHLPLLEAFPDAVSTDRLPQADGRVLAALVVCGRKMPERLALTDAHHLVGTIVAGYGRRARAAATAQGVDWKALSHAVRIGSQALELLSTGHLTLPRPDRLRAIKIGQADVEAVRAEIDMLLEQVEAAQATSVLPETPDRALAELIVLDAYREAVLNDREYLSMPTLGI
jgi:hypothetical protein